MTIKKKKKSKQFFVYTIVYDNICIYVGKTTDLHRRTLEHNRLYRNGYDKELYNYLRSVNFQGKIELIPLQELKSNTEAKRMELYLILEDHFNQKQLKQTPPPIRGW